MELPVKNSNGDTVDSIELDNSVFNVPMNHSLVHQALVIYQMNRRQGTHDTKTRGQVSGGGRKPWIQKHTGRARQGSIRAPQWRHGGVVFGPHPREHRQALPTRMRRQALKCAISEKARRGQLICLDELNALNGKTRSMIDLLNNLGISGSALVVTEGAQANVFQAGHNLKKVWTLPVNLVNTHELLRQETVIMTVAAARYAEQAWAALPRPNRRPPAEPASAPAGSDEGAVGAGDSEQEQ